MTLRTEFPRPGAAPATVYLVGAGPGDPDLLTMRAVKLLQSADVVVYDRLISPEVMALVPKGTAKIFAGKASGAHHLTQTEINELLVRLARPGRIVVRLKGGDPYIFGRGHEEVQALAAHGVACEVVPGVTAAAGCTAALGIPLTHRGTASGVRFLAGHCRDDQALDYDWAGLADPDTTLVVYMGLANIDRIIDELVAAGLPADTSVAAISNGTTAREQVCVGTLGDIRARIDAAGLVPPMLTVIGRVVGLAETLTCVSDLAALPDTVRHDAGA